jgi:hypothetical protein
MTQLLTCTERYTSYWSHPTCSCSYINTLREQFKTLQSNGCICMQKFGKYILGSDSCNAQTDMCLNELSIVSPLTRSRDSSVSIVTLGYGLDGQGAGVLFLAGTTDLSLLNIVETGSGAHPTSYPMDTRGSFLGGKAAGSWSWPFTSI